MQRWWTDNYKFSFASAIRRSATPECLKAEVQRVGCTGAAKNIENFKKNRTAICSHSEARTKRANPEARNIF
jgi:hypothetical protein